MRAITFAVVALALCLPATALAQDDASFDLVCQVRSREVNSDKWWNSEQRLIVDLPRRQFCIDACGYIYPIMEMGDRKIAYDYKVGRTGPDHHADVYRDDSDTNFAPEHEQIVIWRHSLTFFRDFTFIQGDLAAQEMRQISHGTCTLAPFSGIKGEANRRYETHDR